MKKLMAGAAKVKMTPTGECWPAMGLLPNQWYTKVHNDIYARALVLDNGEHKVVFITLELQRAFFAEEIRRILEIEFGIEPGYVFLSGTHTHEGPNLSGIPKDYGGNDSSGEWGEKYKIQVIQAMRKAVETALSKMTDAYIGFGTGNSYINVCRDKKFENGVWGEGADFSGPSDKTLAVLKVTDEKGKMMGALMNYACHGVVCFLKKDEDGNLMLSGDVPGMISSYLEERFEDSVFLWTPAAEGNQNPIVTAKFKSFGHDKVARNIYDPGAASWDICRSLAEEQGSDAAQILDNITDMTNEISFKVSHSTFQVPGMEIKFDSDKFEEIHSMRNGEIPYRGYETDGEVVTIILHLLTINDVGFFFVNGELVSEIGMRLKEMSPLKNTVIITNIEGKAGYIPDTSGYERHTFEYFGSRIKDGKGEEYIGQEMLKMFRNRK